MKNLTNYFHLGICFLLIVSCTEEISEEVKNGTNLTTEESELAKFANKYIRLANKSDPNLEYILHKSGSMREACELKSPTLGFNATNYKKDSGTFTVDCIMDTKEYDLYFSGVDFEVQVDKNLCEYVAYAPYRFFQYLPGSSSKTDYTIECDEQCGKEYPVYCGKKFLAQKQLAAGSRIINQVGTFDPSTFNTYFSSSNVTSIGNTCEYNYSPIGPNCDNGRIYNEAYFLTSEEITIQKCSGGSGGATQAVCEAGGGTWESEVTNSCTANSTLSYDGTSFEKCEGAGGNCLAGPGKDLLSDSKVRVVDQNLELEYFSKAISLEAPYRKGLNSNMYIANFSRVCSSTSAVKDNDVLFDTSLNSIKGHEVEDMPSRLSYPTYSIDEDGNGIVDHSPGGRHIFDGKAWYSTPSNNVKPYYGIYCLDKARDVKAQIRLFIREWDRDYKKDNIYLGKLSDINQTVSLMDTFGEQPDAGDNWNDFSDLDDLLADYDRSPTVDANSDGKKMDNAFYKNQCNNLEYGFCENIAYTHQKDCEDNGHRWRIHSYCSNDGMQRNQADCIGGGGTWIYLNKGQLFPGLSL